MSLKDTWKETGKGLGHGFRDLGKALIKTAAYAADKAEDWANGEEPKPQEQQPAPSQTAENKDPQAE